MNQNTPLKIVSLLEEYCAENELSFKREETGDSIILEVESQEANAIGTFKIKVVIDEKKVFSITKIFPTAGICLEKVIKYLSKIRKKHRFSDGFWVNCDDGTISYRVNPICLDTALYKREALKNLIDAPIFFLEKYGDGLMKGTQGTPAPQKALEEIDKNKATKKKLNGWRALIRFIIDCAWRGVKMIFLLVLILFWLLGWLRTIAFVLFCLLELLNLLVPN